MKTKLLFLIVALLTVFNIFSARAEHKPIIIVQDPTPPGSEVIHRAPVQIPITCFLEDDTNLVVTFLNNLGTISVEIENQTTGEYDQSNVNALVGPMIFAISGTSGLWSITFTLTDGTVYSGDFNL